MYNYVYFIDQCNRSVLDNFVNISPVWSFELLFHLFGVSFLPENICEGKRIISYLLVSNFRWLASNRKCFLWVPIQIFIAEKVEIRFFLFALFLFVRFNGSTCWKQRQRPSMFSRISLENPYNLDGMRTVKQSHISYPLFLQRKTTKIYYTLTNAPDKSNL